MYKKFRSQTRTLRPVPKNCPFCANDTSPSFNEVEVLRRYITERGKILAHTRTGICSKHQRAVAKSVKHARHIALIPFVNRAA